MKLYSLYGMISYSRMYVKRLVSDIRLSELGRCADNGMNDCDDFCRQDACVIGNNNCFAGGILCSRIYIKSE